MAVQRQSECLKLDDDAEVNQLFYAPAALIHMQPVENDRKPGASGGRLIAVKGRMTVDDRVE